MNHLQDELLKTAKEMGAIDAKIFEVEKDIVFDKRTLFKCLFGCPGGYPYCPTTTDVSNVNTYIEMTKLYQWGILIQTDNLKTGQEITLALEKKAFLSGCTFAMATTECVQCKSCSCENDEPCVNKRNVRLPLYALGIDVYKTVRGLGWELEVIQEKGDPVKNITAVFVE